MKTISKKLKETLFGSVISMEGGTPLRSRLDVPTMDGNKKTYYWEGNKGVIVSMLERIEKLEQELSKSK